MTVGVICPTRNRADLWRSAWLTRSIEQQTVPPDEIIVAVDHADDDTIDQVRHACRSLSSSTRIKILEVKVPRALPAPASAIADNCGWHASTADITVHVDDDISMPARCIEHTHHLFEGHPRACIWYIHTFTDDDHNELPEGRDWRLEVIRRRRWPVLPGGLVKPHPSACCSTGATFAVPRDVILESGGHALETAGYHNSDTRLGARLDRLLHGESYLSIAPSTTSHHLGLTWHMQHKSDAAALAAAYGKHQVTPPIANGGRAFWRSEYWADAYKLALDTAGP